MTWKGSKNKSQLHEVVWGEFEHLFKENPPSFFFHGWQVFGKIKERDERRSGWLTFFNVLWWLFFGSGIVISLAVTLTTLYENIFPIEMPDTFWQDLVYWIFIAYFLMAIGSIAWLINNNKQNNEKYRDEVYTFFQRYYDEAGKNYTDWKVSQLKNFLSVARGIREDPDFTDPWGIKEDLWEMQQEYEELLKKLKSNPD